MRAESRVSDSRRFGRRTVKYDVLIIGKGPAGISASVYLARAGYTVLVIGKDQGALERAETIENYYGFQEPVSGVDLVGRGISQALRFGVTVLSEEVVSLAFEEDFLVRTAGVRTLGDATASSGKEHRATALLRQARCCQKSARWWFCKTQTAGRLDDE